MSTEFGSQEMKILVIHGTQKGSVYALTKTVMEQISQKQDVEWIEVGTDDFQLPVCNACQACQKKGQEHCPKFRAFAIAQNGMITCDAVILSGLRHMWAWTTMVKNTFARLSTRNHRPQLLGKQGMAITASSAGLTRQLKKILREWGIPEPMVLAADEAEKMQQITERFLAQWMAVKETTE